MIESVLSVPSRDQIAMDKAVARVVGVPLQVRAVAS